MMTGKPVVWALRVLLIAVLVPSLTPVVLSAQQVGGGVKAGVSLGDLPNFSDSSSADEKSRRVGLAAGGFLMVRFPNGFSIQPEFLYTQKGVRASSPSVSATFKTDFLDVPILARYTFGKVVRGYVFGGPSFDFKTSAKVKSSLIGGSETDVSSNLKSFEFAFVAGGGVELGPILIEARWSEGLTDLIKDTTTVISSPAMKTRTIMFLGGFRF